jgi:predicted dehydrogenase
MVQRGELGPIRQLHVSTSGQLAADRGRPRPGRKLALLAELCGASLVLGDIGTRHHLAASSLGSADGSRGRLGSVMPGRQVHDYGHLLLRLEGGARGSMWVTNSAAGAEHGLHIRVFGDKGGLEWHQEEPNRLLHRPLGGFAQVLTRGRPGLSKEAKRATRIVLGHPEGFHEAFANLYTDAAEAIVARRTGIKPDPLALDFDREDGARGSSSSKPRSPAC